MIIRYEHISEDLMKKLFVVLIIIQNIIFANEKITLHRYNPKHLMSVKNRINNNAKEIIPSYKYLMKLAKQNFKNGPYSVMQKPITPPSGDKHDYMSLSPYWWPDPEKESGLPYIRRDGEVNPEREKYDKRPFANLCETVSILSMAYYFSDKQKYAARTALLIKTWFINDETKMNPNLNFGQGVRGKSDGRSVGIIEVKNLIEVMDAISLIQKSKYWTEDDQRKMELWLSEFLNWLLTDELGIEEGNRLNNHGSWYDVTTSYIAYYIGELEVTKEIISNFALKRIATQVESDGRQPHELERTKAFSYSLFNLRAQILAANLGEKLGIDIWNFTSENGGNIKKEIEFLIPFAIKEKEWPYLQISDWHSCHENMFMLLRICSNKYKEPEYERLILKIPGINTEKSIFNLVYPKKY